MSNKVGKKGMMIYVSILLACVLALSFLGEFFRMDDYGNYSNFDFIVFLEIFIIVFLTFSPLIIYGIVMLLVECYKDKKQKKKEGNEK